MNSGATKAKQASAATKPGRTKPLPRNACAIRNAAAASAAGSVSVNVRKLAASGPGNWAQGRTRMKAAQIVSSPGT
jgi:hypothetical protein